MFRNNFGKSFQDVTTSGGFGHLQKGHGIAIGDIENDGNEDVFAKMGGAFPGDVYQSALFRNPGHGNHWITLVLEGVKSNRAAFGARIRVTTKGTGGKREVYRTVGYGSSFAGNPLRQHIGLGKAKVADEISVFWPTSHTTQIFRGAAADRMYRIREGDRELHPETLKPALISGKPMPMKEMEMHP